MDSFTAAQIGVVLFLNGPVSRGALPMVDDGSALVLFGQLLQESLAPMANVGSKRRRFTGLSCASSSSC